MGKAIRCRKLFACAAVLTALTVVIVVCEIGIRTYHWIMSYRRTSLIQEIVLDEELGWRATGNYSFSGQLRDSAGNPYSAVVTTDGRGFRVFGDPAVAGRPKIFFLGDSFTHAVQVSAGDAYYSIVGRSLGYEVFAYGAGGFGTLQELMVLRRTLDLIRPDVLVIQLCSNDLINNDYDLERASSWNNNGLLRPYLEDGRIVYRIPRPFPHLRRFATKHSEFLYFVFSRLDRLIGSSNRQGVELRIARDGLRFPPFVEAVQTTTRLFSMIREETPASVPVYSFCSDDHEPEHTALRSASRESGLIFVDGVPEAVRQVEDRGFCTRAADGGHWNRIGHQAVGEVVAEFLSREWPEVRNEAIRGPDIQ